MNRDIQGSIKKLDSICVYLKDKPKQKTLLGMAYWQIARGYNMKSDFEQASQFCIKALAELENTDSLKYKASALLEYGNVMFELQDFDKAKKYAIEAGEIALSADDSAGFINSCLLRSNIEYKQGDIAQAYEMQLPVLSYLLAQKDSQNYSAMLANCSVFLMDLERLEEAEKMLLKAVEWDSVCNYPIRQITSTQLLGSLFQEKKEYKKANFYFNKALQLAEKEDVLEAKMRARYGIFKVAMLEKDHLGILDLFNAYDATVDSLYDKELRDKTQSFAAKYELAKKEKSIAELNLENQYKKTLIDEKNAAIRLSLIGVLTLVLILSLGWYTTQLYRQRTKSQLEIAKKSQELQLAKIDQLMKNQEVNMINALLDGQEKERKRVAEELHDRLGSTLSSLKLQLFSIEDKIDDVEKQSQIFEKSNQLLDNAVDEVRRISKNLNSDILSRFGLNAALNDLVDQINSSGQLQFEFHSNLKRNVDVPDVEINLFRVIQELVTNSLKHSKATDISLVITDLDKSISILYEDNGKGFDLGDARTKKSSGIKNMEDRIRRIKGVINFDVRKERGVIVSIEIPLKA